MQSEQLVAFAWGRQKQSSSSTTYRVVLQPISLTCWTDSMRTTKNPRIWNRGFAYLVSRRIWGTNRSDKWEKNRIESSPMMNKTLHTSTQHEISSNNICTDDFQEPCANGPAFFCGPNSIKNCTQTIYHTRGEDVSEIHDQNSTEPVQYWIIWSSSFASGAAAAATSCCCYKLLPDSSSRCFVIISGQELSRRSSNRFAAGIKRSKWSSSGTRTTIGESRERYSQSREIKRKTAGLCTHHKHSFGMDTASLVPLLSFTLP